MTLRGYAMLSPQAGGPLHHNALLPHPREVRRPAMPVSSLLKGISHPQDHILMPRFAVDHQADWQPLTGAATRHRQAAQIQDIANDRVAEILHIPYAVRVHGGIYVGDWQRGNHRCGDEQSIHLAQSLKHPGA